MNVSDYIRAFWEEDAKKPFSPNETRLYFFLLDMMVKQSCVQFECSMRYLETCLLLPKMTITRSRDKLSQRGLIQVVKGDRKVKNPIYFLCGVTKVLPIALPKCDQNVTNQKEETSPTPPKEENIYNNKETSSNDDVKKAKLSSPIQERIDWESFKNTFNELLSSGIPKVIDIKQTRRDLVKARIKEYGKEAISIVLDKVQKSDFLMGRSRRPNDTWKCNFDFIFSKSGFTKIYEGNYDNGEQRTQTNLRASTKPSFANYNEAEAKQVGSINSIEL